MLIEMNGNVIVFGQQLVLVFGIKSVSILDFTWS